MWRARAAAGIIMKVAIVGIGAMASLFASRLQSVSGVVMLGHWPPLLTALRSGLTIVEQDGSTRQYDVNVVEDPREIKGADIAFVLVKSYQTERAAKELGTFLPADNIAFTLQNGLGNLELIAESIGAHRAVQGTTSEGATLLTPGVVRYAGPGKTFLGFSAATEQRVREVASLLTSAGIAAETHGDVRALLWGKLAVNAGINPLTALLGVKNGYLAQHQAAKEVMVAAAREAARVAAALEISLPFTDAGAETVTIARATASNRSSMLQDVMNGRETEIESITGAIVSNAARLGLDVPFNEAIYGLTRSLLAGRNWTQDVSSLPEEVRPMFIEMFAEAQIDSNKRHS